MRVMRSGSAAGPPCLLPDHDEVHVWVARAAEFADCRDALEALLTDRDRAELQVHSGGRPNRRLSRALVRLLVVHYLGRKAVEVDVLRDCPICARPHGRPRVTPLVPGSELPRLQLAVSHSRGLTVLAVAGQNLGVDVEHVASADGTSLELVEFALNRHERHLLDGTPSSLRPVGFLRYWTGKEAVLKALGLGLNVEPRAVHLPHLPPGGRATVDLPDGSRTALWVRPVDVDGEHVCTLATDEPVRTVRVGHLSIDLLLAGVAR